MTLLRPRWVAGHLLVLVLSASFVALGFWQLARNDHKHALVRQARAAYAAPAPDVTGSELPGARVQAAGHYDAQHTVLLRNQVRAGADGNDVLTPLKLADGSAVLVDRGWIAAAGDQVGATNIVTETGPVVVRGLAHTTSSLNPGDSVTRPGGMLSVPVVDLARIGRDVPYKLQAVWIEAQSQTPEPATGAPALPQPPAPDQVNHMQYAVQWFGFALIGIIGWPIALVGFSRRRGGFSAPT